MSKWFKLFHSFNFRLVIPYTRWIITCTWINFYTHLKQWDVITHPFHNSNAAGGRAWMSTYKVWMQLLIHVLICLCWQRGPVWIGISRDLRQHIKSPIARFMGPIWGQCGADRTQVGPMLAPWTLLSEICFIFSENEHEFHIIWSLKEVYTFWASISIASIAACGRRISCLCEMHNDFQNMCMCMCMCRN